MIDRIDLDELGVWYVVRHVSTGADGNGAIRLSMHNQGRYPDRGKDVPHVDLDIEPLQGSGGRRAGAHAQESRPPLSDDRIIHDRWHADIDPNGSSPVGGRRVDGLMRFLSAGEERVVGRPKAPGVTADRDEAGRTIRKGGGEEQAHGPALGITQQGGPCRPDRIQNRPHVVHSLFERSRLDAAVGQPRAALVEKNQSGEPGEFLEKSDDIGLFPKQLDIGRPTRNEYEIYRAVPDNLIRDANPTRMGVTGFRYHPGLPR